MVEPLGLRGRKKLAAMHRIQTVALELFDARGFDAVTVEQIAEAAEVSASSVYRYFGTKEMLVVWDEYDEPGLEAVVEGFAERDPVTVVRQILVSSIADAVEQDRERIEQRMRLVYAHPSIEAASALQAYEMARQIAVGMAHGLGRDPDDLEVQVFAHALVGGVLGALRHWYTTDFAASPISLVDVPLDALEHGLDLAPRHEASGTDLA